ncbi:hypothetical protein NX801_13500 [Streptomyces sp. LP05-1]|uniref:Integral membrane protein n=1 Tax=Streptomyces pyxinae TaxID=2970734 RepID=A0ABT2CGW9_9ACTN|nr:hypothetical protein [Streptomyces sp. LP05-1]MCS0636656.1 hypothetical protein [Streptomyces sp. LP05-1]
MSGEYPVGGAGAPHPGEPGYAPDGNAPGAPGGDGDRGDGGGGDGAPGAREYLILAGLVTVSVAGLAAVTYAAVRGFDGLTGQAVGAALLPARGDSVLRVLVSGATLLVLVPGAVLLTAGRFRRAGWYRAHRWGTALALLTLVVVFWLAVDSATAFVLRTAS